MGWAHAVVTKSIRSCRWAPCVPAPPEGKTGPSKCRATHRYGIAFSRMRKARFPSCASPRTGWGGCPITCISAGVSPALTRGVSSPVLHTLHETRRRSRMQGSRRRRLRWPCIYICNWGGGADAVRHFLCGLVKPEGHGGKAGEWERAYRGSSDSFCFSLHA